MFRIVYAHDGTNVYDLFFLQYLNRKNIVYFLTFNSNPQFVPEESIIAQISEPFAMTSSEAEWVEGLRMYLFCLLRGLLLRIFLKRIKPHVLFGNMATKYGFYSALAGYKPFILVIWGSDILVAPKRSFLRRFMVKFVLKKADAVIVDSDVQENAAISLGCKPQKILKFPWFDSDSVNIKFSRSTIREKLGWRFNPIVISTRKHEPIYGVEYLIEAIPHIIKEAPNIRFLILGKGQLSEKLRQRVRDLGIEQHVNFMGQVTRGKLLACIKASDVYVSTSLSDGTSSSLLEAMTLKVPSIVTRIPGNVEWIKDGWNGILVPAKNPQQLAEKITLLIKDESLRKQIGESALNTINARIDWRTNCKKLDQLISKLASRAR